MDVQIYQRPVHSRVPVTAQLSLAANIYVPAKGLNETRKAAAAAAAAAASDVDGLKCKSTCRRTYNLLRTDRITNNGSWLTCSWSKGTIKDE